MVTEECIYLANYRAGCQVKKLTYNGKDVHLTRTVSQLGIKFSLQEFYQNSKNTASDMLEENYPAASQWLKKLLQQFGLAMEDTHRLKVVSLAGTEWLRRTKRVDREVCSMHNDMLE